MIVIVNCKIGNAGSVQSMLRVLGAESQISSEKRDIERASKLILPGVGAFDKGMQNLAELDLIPTLNRKVLEMKTPILGICLGMQLLSERSEEGKLPGLGWVDGETVHFGFDQPGTAHLKIPHMGWNVIKVRQPHPLFHGLEDEARFYHTHSYHLKIREENEILATTHYGYDFPSSIWKGNVYGVQFHPEKSHRFGLNLLKNFVEL